MGRPLKRLQRFFRELKRRNVYKVGVAYLVAAFVAIQAADLLVPETTLPSGAETVVIYLAVFGFPISLVLAWAFEMTADGVRRTPEAASVDGGVEPREADMPPGRFAVTAFVGLGIVAAAVVGGWYLMGGGGAGESGSQTASAADTARLGEPAAERPFVAVLPLENLSPREENQFFADGIHEELLHQLSKISGLGVKSRTSVRQYADTDKTVREIARELGVEAVMEGSVRRTGDHVRIAAQLIDASTGNHLWSEIYDHTLSTEAIFDVQAEIAERITGALETELAEGERRRIEEAPTEDLAAYDAYLRGRNHRSRFSATGDFDHLHRSIESLLEAVRRDTAFAEAYAWLGLTYAERARLSNVQASQPEDRIRWLDSARAAVERARSLHSGMAESYLAESFIHHARGFTHDARGYQADRLLALRRALELQPNHALARNHLADVLEDRGHYAEAVRAAHEAVRLAPRVPAVLQEMADKLRVVGLYDAAEAWDRHALEVEPGYVESLNGLARTRLLRGDPERALETLEDPLRREESASLPWVLMWAPLAALRADRPERARAYLERRLAYRRRASPEGRLVEPGPLSRALLGLAELRLGHADRGRILLRASADSARAELQNSPDDETALVALVGALASLGEKEEALDSLTLGWERVTDWGEEILVSPLLDSLRSEPRFREIVREIQSNRRMVRERVLHMGLDLYPPGEEPDTVSRADEAPASTHLRR